MPVMISTSRLTRSWRSIGAPGEPLSIVHRLAARAGPDDYMLAAARTVHARCRTPARARCSMCSATRTSRDRPLDGAATPRYLNAGTWSTIVRAGRPPASDRLRLVEIEHSDAPPPTARLLQWDDAPHAAMPAPA